ncbi:hypothetical protein AGMMS49983_01280 [Clostridia bacterium]|nr:hypothetical protein AGMMS49983_01280 [Clostridia bacterium]
MEFGAPIPKYRRYNRIKITILLIMLWYHSPGELSVRKDDGKGNSAHGMVDRGKKPGV